MTNNNDIRNASNIYITLLSRIESPHSSDTQPIKKSHTNGYVDEYLPTASDGNDHDYLSLDEDVPFGDYHEDEMDNVPPPYPATSHSPAERNLNRIKRSDSARSASTSSTRSKTPVAKEVEIKKKEPKQESTKKKKKSKDAVDGNTPSKKHVESETEVKPKQERRKSKDSTKGKSPSKKKKHRDEKKKAAEVIAQPAAIITEVPVKHSALEEKLKAPLSEDNLLASNATLYMPLPDKTNDDPDHLRCDSEVQTDMSGTLSRKPKPKVVEEVAAPVVASPQHAANLSQPAPSDVASPPTSSSTDPTKFVEDFCKMMLNFQNMALKNQNEKDKDPPPSQSQLPDPKVMNPFAAFYPNHQGGQHPTPPHSLYSQFPPHVSYQLYMSWMAAYYAGATGSLPPPPPFSSYPSMGSEKATQPPFDYQNFPSVFQPHPAYMRDGYTSSQASPQKEPYQSFDNSMMYHSNNYNQPPQKASENFGSEPYDYPRSQSPFENLASISVSGSEKAG